MTRPVITKCRSCNADIVWMWTANDKKMPVNADSIADTDDHLTEYDRLRHMTHYATCPQAKSWTKKGKK